MEITVEPAKTKITLTISASELSLLKKLMARNRVVPQALLEFCTVSEADANELTKLMDEFYRAL